ncbi:MAG: alpha/beta fold hydrolase [Paracoccaceae bacterium]
MRRIDWNEEGARWPGADATRFLEAGGLRWRLVRRGPDGAPRVLLLHGAGASAHSWAGVMEDLAADHDVIAPDLPGHGFSTLPVGRRQALPVMAREVGDLIDVLGVSPDLIAGHSAGAAVALRLTLDGRAAPRLIYAINGALTPFRGLAGVLFPPMARALSANPLTPRAFALAASGDSDTARRLIRGTGSRIPEAGLKLYQRLFRNAAHVDGALRMMAQWDLEPLLEDLPDLPCPLVLAVGEADKAVPPDQAETLAARLPFVELERHDLGHVMHEEAPSRFAGRIRERLAATGSTSRARRA